MPITWPPATHDDVSAQAYAAGGGDHFRSGYYFHGLFTGAAFAPASMGTAGFLKARPFHLPVRRSFDRIGLNVTTAATAGGVLRMGVYSHAAGPDSLIADGGTVDATTTGPKFVAVSITLDPGVYWLAVVSQVAVASVTAYNGNTVVPFHSETVDPPTTASSSLGVTVNSGTVTSTLPATFPAWSGTTGIPVVCLRAT